MIRREKSRGRLLREIKRFGFAFSKWNLYDH